MNNNCCMDCAKRKIGCHSKCKDCEKFKENLKKINSKRNDYKEKSTLELYYLRKILY